MPHPVSETAPATSPGLDRRERFLAAALLGLCLTLGFLQFLTGALRPHTNPDGLSYIEMGEAYLRGDWGTALNRYWSPLYAWVLGVVMRVAQPSMLWEIPLIQAVNLVIFLSCLVAFGFFWRELIRRRRSISAPSALREGVTFSEAAWWAMGLALFGWSSFTLVGVHRMNPDMLAAALVYAVAGCLLRLQDESPGPRVFAVFGGLLGVMCLARLSLLPIAVLFLGIGFISTRNRRGSLAAAGGFLLVAGPLLVALSVQEGRPSFGAAARLNYAWYVNGVPSVHWRGEPPGSGQPVHPTRQLLDSPPVFEFARTGGITYSPWYDPAFWNEGVRPRLDAQDQVLSIAREARNYDLWFIRKLGGAFAVVLVLYGVSRDRRAALGGLAAWWILLLPALAALAMYGLVHVEARHVAPFILLLCGGLLAGIPLPDVPIGRRLASVTPGLLVVVILIDLGVYASKSMKPFRDAGRDRPWVVAEGLHRMGVQAGDPVATLGTAMHDPFWAHLAEAQIVAEAFFVPGPEFWADSVSHRRVVESLLASGAAAIVAEDVPPDAQHKEWRRIGTTDYYLLTGSSPRARRGAGAT